MWDKKKVAVAVAGAAVAGSVMLGTSATLSAHRAEQVAQEAKRMSEQTFSERDISTKLGDLKRDFARQSEELKVRAQAGGWITSADSLTEARCTDAGGVIIDLHPYQCSVDLPALPAVPKG